MSRAVDLGIALLIVAIGAYVFVVSAAAPPRTRYDMIGPFGFSGAVGAVLVLAGSALTVRHLRLWRAGAPPDAVADGTADEREYPASASRAGLVMAGTFAYTLLIAPLGYLISTPLYVIFAMVVMSERSRLMVVGVAAGYTILTWLVFGLFLGVPIPLGPLEELFIQLGIVDRFR